MRPRLPPASACATPPRTLATRLLRHWSATLRAVPGGFWGLAGPYPRWVIPWPASGFVERGVGWGREGGLIRHLCGVSCARGGWAELAHLASVCVDQPQVLVSLRLLLAAVMRLVRHGGRRTLAVAFRPVHGPSGPAFEPQGRGRHGARGPCWLHP
jgi:hypothetical protein